MMWDQGTDQGTGRADPPIEVRRDAVFGLVSLVTGERGFAQLLTVTGSLAGSAGAVPRGR
jgi:hypothetical protein